MSSKRRGDAAGVELIPMDQFKEFVRRVVSVPKKEIDRARERVRKRRDQHAKPTRRHG